MNVEVKMISSRYININTVKPRLTDTSKQRTLPNSGYKTNPVNTGRYLGN